jgi:hypothetical protein
LLDHRPRSVSEGVIPRQDGHARTHHHIVANCDWANKTSVAADSGSGTKAHLSPGTKMSGTLDVHIAPAFREQAGA